MLDRGAVILLVYGQFDSSHPQYPMPNRRTVARRVMVVVGLVGVYLIAPAAHAIGTDTDGDGIPDDHDNCPRTLNIAQADLDSDGRGDACDPDVDGDGYADGMDNCPRTANPNPSDYDRDGFGDVCDPCPQFFGTDNGCPGGMDTGVDAGDTGVDAGDTGMDVGDTAMDAGDGGMDVADMETTTDADDGTTTDGGGPVDADGGSIDSGDGGDADDGDASDADATSPQDADDAMDVADDVGRDSGDGGAADTDGDDVIDTGTGDGDAQADTVSRPDTTAETDTPPAADTRSVARSLAGGPSDGCGCRSGGDGRPPGTGGCLVTLLGLLILRSHRSRRSAPSPQ